jgi:hypothetical protein
VDAGLRRHDGGRMDAGLRRHDGGRVDAGLRRHDGGGKLLGDYSAAIAIDAGRDNASSNCSRRTCAVFRFASFTGPKPLI